MRNTLFYGDNLSVLREHIPDESVDLVYLDPPFNSNASYNVLFKEKTGEESPAQIKAFTDTWEWTQEAERTFEHDIILNANTPSAVKDMITALRQFVGNNALMAYLVMMTPRLVELCRALKPTGSLYLHCDPTSSHYLKVLLDTVFGKDRFRNEITWKRTFSHGNVGRNFGSICDTLFWYGKSDDDTWNQLYTPFPEDYVERTFKHQDTDGRRWQSVTLRNPGPRPNLHYPYTASDGVTYHPHPNGWTCNVERMKQYDRENRLHFPSNKTGALRLKMYLDESAGVRMQNLWTDIPPIGAQAAERLGYPTQKPLALLERIIQASSNEGDVVLDPFCGCGTAVAAAEKLKRKWIGVDITHLAVALMKNRLKTMFDLEPGEDYDVVGEPTDVGGARALWEQDPYQFQYWATSLLEAYPQEQKRGADRGIDGLVYFVDGPRRTPHKAVIQVKGGRVAPSQMRDLKGVVGREKAALGLFITLEEPTREMRSEAASGGFFHSDIWDRDFPTTQIRTVEELLEGRQFEIPSHAAMFQPAQRVRPSEGRQGRLDDAVGA